MARDQYFCFGLVLPRYDLGWTIWPRHAVNLPERGSRATLSDLSRFPADRLWGAQTERSLHNFRIGTERMPIEIVHALGVIKRASAEVNRQLGSLDRKRASVIAAVAQDIADGKLDEHFPFRSGKPDRARRLI